MLTALEFEISSFKTKKTENIEVEGPEGEASEVAGIKSARDFAEAASMSEKERQDFLGSWLLKADQAIRDMLGISTDVNGILSKEARTLWTFLESDKENMNLTGVTFTDAQLSAMSEKIFGKKISESGIQRIRSSTLHQFQEMRVKLGLTGDDMIQSMDNGILDLDSKVMKAIAAQFENVPKPERIPEEPPAERKRRTLTPSEPNTIPERKPKAVYENEMDIIKKIVQKYKKLK
jgi:hypothetical protein